MSYPEHHNKTQTAPLPLLAILALVSGTPLPLNAGLAWAVTDSTVAPSTPISRVSYVPIASFPGMSLAPVAKRNTWSPDGRYAVLSRKDSLFVFDALSPAAPPRRVLAQYVQNCTWSPSGNWLLCRVQTQDDIRRGLGTFIAVSADSGTAVTLLERAGAKEMLWAPDGRILIWYDNADGPRFFEPPLMWRRGVLTVDSTLDVYVSVTRHKPMRQTLHRFDSRGEDIPNISTVAPNSDDIVSIATVFAQGNRLLVDIFEHSGRSRSAIVDREGRIVVELTGPRGCISYQPLSVSYDGQYLIGYTEEGTAPSERIESAPLLVSDASGAWTIRVSGAPNVMHASFSPASLMFASYDPVTGASNVGTLSFGSR